MNIRILLLVTAAAFTLWGCASKQTAGIEVPERIELSSQPLASPAPKAIAYKISGGATAANVPIQVDNQGNIVSFPDPADLKNAEPIELKDGYLLDRRGVNTNTRFLTYTYNEYSALSAPPSVAELKAAIIADARVAEIVRLPMTVSQAVADIDAVNSMLP